MGGLGIFFLVFLLLFCWGFFLVCMRGFFVGVFFFCFSFFGCFLVEFFVYLFGFFSYHISSLFALLGIANWKWVLWKYSPAQLTLLFQLYFLRHTRISNYVTYLLFVKVLLSYHQQKSLFTLNSLLPILITWKDLLCFRKYSLLKFYIAKFGTGDNDFSIFSSKEIPFSQQTDHLFEILLENSPICELFH